MGRMLRCPPEVDVGVEDEDGPVSPLLAALRRQLESFEGKVQSPANKRRTQEAEAMKDLEKRVVQVESMEPQLRRKLESLAGTCRALGSEVQSLSGRLVEVDAGLREWRCEIAADVRRSCAECVQRAFAQTTALAQSSAATAERLLLERVEIPCQELEQRFTQLERRLAEAQETKTRGPVLEERVEAQEERLRGLRTHLEAQEERGRLLAERFEVLERVRSQQQQHHRDGMQLRDQLAERLEVTARRVEYQEQAHEEFRIALCRLGRLQLQDQSLEYSALDDFDTIDFAAIAPRLGGLSSWREEVIAHPKKEQPDIVQSPSSACGNC